MQDGESQIFSVQLLRSSTIGFLKCNNAVALYEKVRNPTQKHTGSNTGEGNKWKNTREQGTG